ncbi:ribbon-helix-helix domain-containing protein [Leucobacter chromiiresistens]|uniref:Ribbon-helix-helix protein, copG family n=1 Tax=Leucobacter chromiiresistens TaxID=1079994 RepID=A0A1H0YKU2_9MICO|nr:ribbon-helix-helix domain-containing protein [Leucobacter chromiiresistens]SDQ15794.1 Ribbon-helix-helix protein, copG family [Leucobacter chromiiresistens]
MAKHLQNTDTVYTASNGTTFTEADIERWAMDAEAGFPDADFGPPTAGRPTGRPRSVGESAPARPYSVRLDEHRIAKLKRIAKDRHKNTSELMRDLIDAL